MIELLLLILLIVLIFNFSGALGEPLRTGLIIALVIILLYLLVGRL